MSDVHLKISEAIAISLALNDGVTSKDWRQASKEVREKYRAEAASLLSEMNTAGLRLTATAQKLDKYLQEAITIPATPAYVLGE